MWSLIAGVILLAVLAAGCASATASGPRTPTERIEKELQRGVSTRADVRRVLGTAKGGGSAILPTDPRQRDVWMYLDVKTGKARQTGERMVHVESTEQMLLVFFLDGVLDGFMWYEGAGIAEVK
jgi:hypothetical protein